MYDPKMTDREFYLATLKHMAKASLIISIIVAPIIYELNRIGYIRFFWQS